MVSLRYMLLVGCIASSVACADALRATPPLQASSPTVLVRAQEPAVEDQPVSRTDREPAPPSPEALQALLSQHRDSSPPPPPGEHGLGVPVDWKVLPQSAVTWTYASRTDEMFVAGNDTVVTRHADTYTALDVSTGVERWSRDVPAFPSATSTAVAACDDVVVFFLPDAIVGADSHDGHERWRVRTRRSRSTDLMEVESSGCMVGFFRAPGSTALARDGGASDFWTLDARTGHATRIARCGGHCRMTEVTETHLIMQDSSVGTTSIVRATGEVVRGDYGMHFVEGGADSFVVVARTDGHGAGAVRLDGRVVWERRLLGEVKARVESDVVVLDGDTIRRIRLVDGGVVWSLVLSPELSSLVADREEWAADSRRLVVTNGGMPSFLLVVDFASGRLEALRLAPSAFARLALLGERLLLDAPDGIVGIDLTRESPPIRDHLTLEADVRRSAEELIRLHRTEPERRFGHVPTYAYPRGYQANDWLRRLGPLAAPTLRAMLSEASIEDAAPLATAVGFHVSSESQALLVTVLRRTYASRPTVSVARLREATLEALAPSLPRDVPAELVERTVEWLRQLRDEEWFSEAGYARCESDAEACERMRATVGAIRAAHAALERTSVDPAPIDALRRAVRGASTAVASSCNPSETDLVLNAALVHAHLFDEGYSGHVIVPRGSCVELVTAAGAVALDASGAGRSAPYVAYGEPRTVTLPIPSPDADPEWSRARTYDVPVVIYGGPVTALGGVFTVKHVGGIWRVVAVSWTGSA